MYETKSGREPVVQEGEAKIKKKTIVFFKTENKMTTTFRDLRKTLKSTLGRTRKGKKDCV